MPKIKKKAYQKKSFESTGANNDVSSNIYMSMILSEAWQDLSPKQQQLYLCMKLQYYGQGGRRAVDQVDNTKFHFNKGLWHKVYHLYPETADGRFNKDLVALISHGFVRVLECGQITRTKTIYQYSDMWQKWNTPDFKILVTDMNTTMLRQYRNNNTDNEQIKKV